MISVLYDPLFSVVFRNGQSDRLGLIDLLSQAHQIDELKAHSCTGKLALLRLCMAFLMDAYRPELPEDRTALLEAGSFDRALLMDYVKKCEDQWPCFMLDDEKHPFMQAAYEASLDAKAEKPVCKIMFDRPGGNNHIHLDHRYENQHECDTANALEAMLETYLFCPAGLSGASNVNNMPPVYALIHGRNLFETLVLNMVSEDEIGSIPYGGRETAWTRNEKVIPGNRAIQMSLLKAFTWQPRRLTLCWDGDGLIRRIYLQNGLNFQGNGLWQDPHVLYRETRDGNMVSIKPELGRELWRDAGVLTNRGANTHSTIPIQNLQNNIWPDRPQILDIEMVGMVTSNESILGRVNERLQLPARLFEDEKLASYFYSALEINEQMYRALDKAVKWQYCHPGEKKKKSAIAQQAGEVFLHEMHSVLFDGYVSWLQEDAGVALERYLDAMWGILDESVLKNVIDKTGNDIASIERQNAVRGKVRKAYNIIREGVEG